MASVVYFIKAENKNLFKIGHTASDVALRVRAINVGCPYDVALYATIPGDRETESQVHGELCRYHMKGEWFEVPLSVINMLLINTSGHFFASDKVDHARMADRKPAKGKRKKRKSRGRPSLKCEVCEAPKGKRGKYCSNRCRQRAFRERRKAA